MTKIQGSDGLMGKRKITILNIDIDIQLPKNIIRFSLNLKASGTVFPTIALPLLCVFKITIKIYKILSNSFYP
jgi:hypothetical protein